MNRKMSSIIKSNALFAVLALVFIVIVGIASVVRQGNDLKVDIYGAEEIQARRSPYFNPHDPERTIYRYAPPFALMMYPFLAVNRIFGVTLSRADFSAAFNYSNITLTLVFFYLAKVLKLAATLYLLLKLMPLKDKNKSIANLKLSFLLCSPFIAYELVNNQNKLMALFFLVAALVLFERSRPWLSGIFFNMAMVIYIPLAVFILYFLKYKKSYVIMILAGFIIVFIVAPSLILGFDYNNQLVKEWYEKCLKPFFSSGSYSAFMVELRKNSQSLPSAVGRIFCRRLPTGAMDYHIPASAISIIIKVLSSVIVALSVLAIWLSPRAAKGLQISVLLLISMLLPSYCLVYTWAYLVVVYFFMLDYAIPPAPAGVRKPFFGSIGLLVIAALLMTVEKTFYMSVLCWTTIVLWACLIFAMFKTKEKTA